MRQLSCGLVACYSTSPLVCKPHNKQYQQSCGQIYVLTHEKHCTCSVYVQVEQKLGEGQLPLDQLAASLTILCSRKQQLEAPFKLLLAAYTRAAASASALQTSQQCWQIMRVCAARLHTPYVKQLAEVIRGQHAATEAQGIQLARVASLELHSPLHCGLFRVHAQKNMPAACAGVLQEQHACSCHAGPVATCAHKETLTPTRQMGQALHAACLDCRQCCSCGRQ
jgi:hypothetical protein